MATWVIGDIHGCFDTLKALVDKINLTPQDELFLLGDYIDRGNDSKKVMDYLMELEQSCFQIYPILGNHEWFLLESYNGRMPEKNWRIFGGEKTLKSFDADTVLKIPEVYINWLKKLPLYIEKDRFIFVHAGLNFAGQDIFADTHSLLFVYDFRIDFEKLGNRTIIHGHHTIEKAFLLEQKPHYQTDGFIDIDTGCVYNNSPGMGVLTALNLDTLDFIFQENIEKQ